MLIYANVGDIIALDKTDYKERSIYCTRNIIMLFLGIITISPSIALAEFDRATEYTITYNQTKDGQNCFYDSDFTLLYCEKIKQESELEEPSQLSNIVLLILAIAIVSIITISAKTGLSVIPKHENRF